MPRPSTPIIFASAALLLAMAGTMLGFGSRERRAPLPTASSSPPRHTAFAGAPADSGVEAELREFRKGIAHVPAELEHAAPSRDALVTEFARAVEQADTAALARLAITRAEYAYLIYPSSPFVRPPYRQPPDLAWEMLVLPGNAGFRRILERYAGRPLHVAGYRCDPEPVIEGENRLWKHCDVRLASPGAEPRWLRLFGVIVERRGRFKLASYENKL